MSISTGIDFLTIPSGQYIQHRKQADFPVFEGMHLVWSISGLEDLQSPVLPASALQSFERAQVKGSLSAVFEAIRPSSRIFLVIMQNLSGASL
jgi:hypothetical protein